MSIFDLVVPVILALSGVQQLAGVIWFVLALSRTHRRQQTTVNDDELPLALVVLKLRGADPYLRDCLRGLIQQDHPRYQVRIIVDSKEDAAWPVVQEVLDQLPADQLPADRIEVQSLIDPAETCSLVCSAMLQATADLPPECQVIATLDSDVVAHRTWLRELVTPLLDADVGVTRGIRWFAPPLGKWGSWVRYLWNLAVEVTSYFTEIPWGGSVAMKVSVLGETNLRQRWQVSANEDILIGAAMRRLRLRMVWVSSLVMVNREECDMPGCFRFMHRQQIWGRLYNPLAFWANAAAFVLIVTAVLWGLTWSVVASFQYRWWVVAINLIAIVGIFVAQALIVVLMESMVHRLLAAREMNGAQLHAKTFLALALSPFWSAYILCRSMAVNSYEWRGVEYEAHGPWTVKMKYRPYPAGLDQPETSSKTTRFDSL